MLYSLDSQTYLADDYVPHRRDFERWRARLTDEEYARIYAELCACIDGDEIATSSWIPGSDWTGLVYEPIWAVACRRDQNAAARFFGLLLWVVVRDHDEVWAFGRYEKNGVPIEGMTYFKLSNPPPR